MGEFLNCILPPLAIILAAAGVIALAAIIIAAILVAFPALLPATTAAAIAGLPVWLAVLTLLLPFIGPFVGAVAGSIALAVAACLNSDSSVIQLQSSALSENSWKPVLSLALSFGFISFVIGKVNPSKD